MAKNEKPVGGAFGWKDEAEVSEGGYTLLPEGEALFSITKVERVRKEFGKFGTINVAVLTLLCSSMDPDARGGVEIKLQLGLHADLGWKILQLATSCGLRKHGDPALVHPAWWDQFEGQVGRCMVAHRRFAKKDDKPGEKTGLSNEITEFLDPAEAPAADDDIKF
jgi:hypothetical protein